MSTIAVLNVRRTGRRGENRHKIQCAALTEARARYMERAKREIKEMISEFGMQTAAGEVERSTSTVYEAG